MDCIGCGACAFACPTQCIKMTEENGVRKIWGREFKLAVCPVCGNYYAPIEQLEKIQKQVNLPPDHFKVCFTCRGLKI
jgi:ferredoxin